MAKPKLRIVIADDHPVVRAGVRQLLCSEFDAQITEFETAAEVLDAVRRSTFDLILLDVSMPGRSGLSILAELRVFQPETPVLVLSMHGEEQFAVRALRAGANGYVTKSSVSTDLLKAVEQVLRGDRYVSDNLAQHLASAVVTGQGDAAELLSEREFEVLRLIATGKSGKEIAADLSLSFKTVSTYRTRLLEKLKLHSTAELVRYAVRNRLIDEPATDV